MWIHLILLLVFVVLFIISKGFFSKAGQFLTRLITPYYPIDVHVVVVFLIAIFCGNAIGGIVTWTEQSREVLQFLERNEPGGDGYEEEVQLNMNGTEQKVTIQVEPQTYTEEEVKKQMKDALDRLSTLILGKNQSMEHVDHDLDLIENIPGTGITISWESDYPEYMDWEGHLTTEVPEEGAPVCLTAELSCQDERRIYKQYLTAYPSVQSENEILQKQVEQAVTEQNDTTEDKLKLPETVMERKVQWSRQATHMGWMLLGLGLIVGVLYGARQKNLQKNESETRQKQMNLDYPQIVNKLVLLMNAGMSMRKAFSKIALDYQKDVQSGKKRRSAYDEVLVAYHEMESGVLETEAYLRFGDRCDNIHYKTFTTLLVQNIRKGSRELIQMLEREALEAFEERKARARVLGEEAGTKLLLPMIIMFVLVLAILMIPAYMSF